MKTLRLLPALLFLAAATPATASDEVLVGLRSVRVHVNVSRELAEALPAPTLQTDVELRLRQSGLRVEPDAPVMLRVNLFARKISGQVPGYEYVLEVETVEEVRVLRNLVQSEATTWNSNMVLGSFGKPTEAYLREQVRDRVDEFLNAYLAANPRFR